MELSETTKSTRHFVLTQVLIQTTDRNNSHFQLTKEKIEQPLQTRSQANLRLHEFGLTRSLFTGGGIKNGLGELILNM